MLITLVVYFILPEATAHILPKIILNVIKIPDNAPIMTPFVLALRTNKPKEIINIINPPAKLDIDVAS
uniref:Putative secreted protein n=1 Tax=Panstrongylus lignarius TaxID=156445 RepID=A0A224XYF3_9HEMI